MKNILNKIYTYIKLLRVKHYIKNLLIFIPLAFSGKLFDIELLYKSGIAFVIFSFISSIVYIINDIKDVEKDRIHSTKRKRPIAAGKVSIKAAQSTAVILSVISGLLIWLSAYQNIYVIIFPIIYLIINIMYSIKMKNIPIVDITILAVGFLLRVLMGSATTGIAVSEWLCLTVFAGSFYMALGKRRNEIRNEGVDSRSVLKKYTNSFLDKNMYMCMSLTIAFYSLWCIDARTVERISSDKLLWTIPVVIVMALKYGLNLEGDSDGDPVEVLTHDKFLICLGIIYALMMFFIVYV